MTSELACDRQVRRAVIGRAHTCSMTQQGFIALWSLDSTRWPTSKTKQSCSLIPAQERVSLEAYSAKIIVPHPDGNACGACINVWYTLGSRFGGLRIWSAYRDDYYHWGYFCEFLFIKCFCPNGHRNGNFEAIAAMWELFTDSLTIRQPLYWPHWLTVSMPSVDRDARMGKNSCHCSCTI